jgi:hypothetical protein
LAVYNRLRTGTCKLRLSAVLAVTLLSQLDKEMGRLNLVLVTERAEMELIVYKMRQRIEVGRLRIKVMDKAYRNFLSGGIGWEAYLWCGVGCWTGVDGGE